MQMIRAILWLTILTSAIVSAAQAQSLGSAISAGTTTGSLSSTPDFLKSAILTAGVKSTADSGRPYELQSARGLEFKTRNEMFLGFKSSAGWGVYGQGMEYTKTFNDSTLNKFAAGDPSLTVLHPVYENGNLKITGAFREYFPVSDHSLSRGKYQQAYYSNLTYKLSGRWDIFNQFIPRYFSQRYYAPTDGTVFVEDLTLLTHRVNSWFRYGVGQHAQVEAHNVLPVGKTLEIFPFADFMISNSVFAGPRLYLPLAAQNTVYEAPTGVSLNNVQAEFYLQATL